VQAGLGKGAIDRSHDPSLHLLRGQFLSPVRAGQKSVR
jgi:hypothetical protein